VVSWQWSGMPAAAVSRRRFSAGFIREHLHEASMPIEWMNSIRESFHQRTKVQVSQRQQNLAGKIGTIMRVGFDGFKEFYELQFQGSKGRKVVAAQFCSLYCFGGEGLSSGEGSHISHLTSHISHLTSHIGTGKERGQGSSAVGGNGDMSKSAPVQESLRSSRQDGASKGNGKEGDVVVRPQEQRNLAGELVAPEFEQGKYSPEQDHTSHLSHLTSHI